RQPPLGCGAGDARWFKITKGVVLNPLERRTSGAFLCLRRAVALAPVVFALLLAGWLAALLLSVTPASVPVLLAFRWCVRRVALAEAWLARELLGARTRVVPARPRGSGFWAAGKAVLADSAFWRQQVFLVLRMVGGSAVAIGAASLLAAGGFAATLPLYYSHSNSDLGFTKIDTFGKALACVPVGLLVLAAGVLLLRPLAAPFVSAA